MAGRGDAVPRVRGAVLQERRRSGQPAQPVLGRVGARARGGHRCLPPAISPPFDRLPREAQALRRWALGRPPRAAAGEDYWAEELRDILPELLWLSQMGLVLYWIFDRTEGRERSYRLAERGAKLTARGVSLARFRVLRPLVREVHELFTDFLPGMSKVMPDPGRKT